ncbi:actin-binding Rho-activating protein-like [Bombina bombina]|uniref:actin-binding Rho-activating protein-like n=1 Tax=Bombina bombina TaxID=8345 RepID=UPI00235B1B7A|nr:actin-binding Rho-activating protein-like [Bombina bombina]XP_053556445.1 actin-binding Rho-activating protein-like [Bombina bombina]
MMDEKLSIGTSIQGETETFTTGNMETRDPEIMGNNKDKCAEAENRRKELLSKIKIMTMSDIRKEWQSWSDAHTEKQKRNPFSEDFDHSHAMAVRLHKGDNGYGRPEEGSKTEERGNRAKNHIHKEIEEMCLIIRDMGVKGRDGRIRVTFGRLFQQYVRISDKVVGILLRARKHKHLDFEGEMLWQGVHDNVVITLLD